MKVEVSCEMCGLKVEDEAACGAEICEVCARARAGEADELERELEEVKAAAEHREAWRRAYERRGEINALNVRIANERAEAAEREARQRAAGEMRPRGAIALDARHIHIKRLIWQREEARRDIMSLDRLILEAAERAATAGVTAQEVVDAVASGWKHEAFVEASRVAAELHRDGAEQRQRGGAALEALETARPVEAPEEPPRTIFCPDCGGSGEWQGDSWTRARGGYRCSACDGTGQIPAPPEDEAPAGNLEVAKPDPYAGSSIKVEPPAVNVEPLERRLAALDGPEEGETWGAFHARAAAELIGHYTGAGEEEDTRAELREAIDHIVKAADEAAAERGAATVKRVEELLAAHHQQIGAALDVMKRGAVVEALNILNTATGAAARALLGQPEDPAVD